MLKPLAIFCAFLRVSFLEWLQSTCYTGALWVLWFKDAWRYFRIILLVPLLPEAASADFQTRWSFQDDDFPRRISLTSVILLMSKKNEPLIQQSWAFHFCGENLHPVASGSKGSGLARSFPVGLLIFPSFFRIFWFCRQARGGQEDISECVWCHLAYRRKEAWLTPAAFTGASRMCPWLKDGRGEQKQHHCV